MYREKIFPISWYWNCCGEKNIEFSFEIYEGTCWWSWNPLGSGGGKGFHRKRKNAIVQKDLIPRWPSHKKSDFAKNIEAVISSSNIQKRKQGILNKAVSDFEKDPLNLSLEISSRKGIVRLAQILDYSFSVGKPKHQLLIAIFNCPEPRKFGRQP